MGEGGGVCVGGAGSGCVLVTPQEQCDGVRGLLWVLLGDGGCCWGCGAGVWGGTGSCTGVVPMGWVCVGRALKHHPPTAAQCDLLPLPRQQTVCAHSPCSWLLFCAVLCCAVCPGTSTSPTTRRALLSSWWCGARPMTRQSQRCPSSRQLTTSRHNLGCSSGSRCCWSGGCCWLLVVDRTDPRLPTFFALCTDRAVG